MKKIFILIFSIGLIVILLNFIPVQVYHNEVNHVSIFYYNGDHKINYTKLFFYIFFLLLSCICVYYSILISKPYIFKKKNYNNLKEIDNSPSAIELNKSIRESKKQKNFKIPKGLSDALLLIAIILSILWILVEIVHYYKKYDRLALESHYLFKEEYKFNYWLLTYLGISILLRCKGLYNYITRKTSPFIEYYYGQLMAIAIIIGYYDSSSKFWIIILISEVSFILIFAYYDKEFLQNIKTRKQKSILFIIATFSFLGCAYNILDAIDRTQSTETTQLLIASMLLIATSITLYGLILIYNNDYTGFNPYFIGQGIEVALFITLFIVASQRFPDMIEERVSSITNHYITRISPTIFMTIVFYFYKRNYPFKSDAVNIKVED